MKIGDMFKMHQGNRPLLKNLICDKFLGVCVGFSSNFV